MCQTPSFLRLFVSRIWVISTQVLPFLRSMSPISITLLNAYFRIQRKRFFRPNQGIFFLEIKFSILPVPPLVYQSLIFIGNFLLLVFEVAFINLLSWTIRWFSQSLRLALLDFLSITLTAERPFDVTA